MMKTLKPPTRITKAVQLARCVLNANSIEDRSLQPPTQASSINGDQVTVAYYDLIGSARESDSMRYQLTGRLFDLVRSGAKFDFKKDGVVTFVDSHPIWRQLCN